MSRNSGGTYSRLTPPGAGGYVAGTVIKPSEVNGELNDFKNEITDSVSRSGKGAALANLPMGGFKHTGAAAATANGDYVEFGQYTTALAGKQASLGFTPVQQGGGIGQSSNKVYIGWSGSARLKLTVDVTDFGNFVMDSDLTPALALKANLAGAAFTGAVSSTGNITSSANVQGANVISIGTVQTVNMNATGTINNNAINATGGTLNITGAVTTTGDITATGNITAPKVNAINTAKAFLVFDSTTPSILQSSDAGITVTKTAAGKFIIDNLPGMTNAWYAVHITQDLNNLDFTIYNRSATYFYIDFFARGGGFTNPNVVSITIHGGSERINNDLNHFSFEHNGVR